MRFTFPRWSLPAAALTPILLLAACADSAAPPPQVEKAQPASLYDRLGGKPAIAAVVDDFVANVAADKRVNAAFRKANTARLKARLNEQLCEASGGPCKYAGRSMKTVHKSMGITDAQFDAVVEDFKKTLDKFRVPSTEQAELTAILAPMRADIVTRTAKAAAQKAPAKKAPAQKAPDKKS